MRFIFTLSRGRAYRETERRKFWLACPSSECMFIGRNYLNFSQLAATVADESFRISLLMNPSTDTLPTPQEIVSSALANRLGSSAETPIVIPRRTPNDYVAEEQWILQELLKTRDITHADVTGQTLIGVDDRSLDRITVCMYSISDHAPLPGARHTILFFDVTDCLSP